MMADQSAGLTGHPRPEGEIAPALLAFPDPAAVAGPPERQLAAFREVRDDIEYRVLEWLGDPDTAEQSATPKRRFLAERRDKP